MVLVVWPAAKVSVPLVAEIVAAGGGRAVGRGVVDGDGDRGGGREGHGEVGVGRAAVALGERLTLPIEHRGVVVEDRARRPDRRRSRRWSGWPG